VRKLLLIALIAILGGAFYLIRDPGHIPIFDASLNRLAESEVEAYCAGTTYWQNRGANATAAADCRTASGMDPNPDITIVTDAFCRAVREAGYPGAVEACQSILSDQKLWPTYDGGLTQSWSKTAPYPGDAAFVIPQGDSRTGTRDGFSRDDEAPPTTQESTTTTEGEQ
jgi:hypothetical protein